LFNSILCRANEALVRIAAVIGEPDEVPLAWAEKTADAVRSKLWHEEHGIFDAYDLVSGELIEVDTAAGFLPLFAGAASREQAKVLYDRLKVSAEFEYYRVLANGLRKFDPSHIVGRRAKLAFWTNLYNTIVVDAIVALGVKDSVKEVPGFFRNLKYSIGGYLFSADDIEHGILRGNVRPWFSPLRPFRAGDPRRALMISPVDPRIHFALVCGSRSCVPIDYYDGGRIYEQLEEAATSFVNSSEVLVFPEEDKMLVSEIFRWYERDFGGKQGTIDFIFDYLVDASSQHFIRDNAGRINMEYLHYDWDLNR
jgi:hypothetical protein